jgi:carbon-monoxide dehydrogenase medium subunit
LDKHGQEAKLLAGGTDLIVSLRARERRAKSVVDVKGVRELHQLSYDEKRGLNVGAAVTINELLHHHGLTKGYSILSEAISTIGDFEIRNRATLAGNICNASPAADSAPALLVLDANVNVVNRKGKRTVPLRDFFAGVKKTTIANNEIVTSIDIPPPPKESKGAYLKARRTVGEDLCIVGVGGLVTPNPKSGKSVRLAYSSVAPTPVRALEAEKIFEKAKPVDDLLDEAMPIVRKTVSPISDVRGGKEYRANLVEVLTRRLIRQLWEAT